jgi:hypothetical protein
MSLFLKPARRAPHDLHHIMRQEQEDATPLKPNPCYPRRRRRAVSQVPYVPCPSRLGKSPAPSESSHPRSQSLTTRQRQGGDTYHRWVGTYVAGTSAHPKKPEATDHTPCHRIGAAAATTKKTTSRRTHGLALLDTHPGQLSVAVLGPGDADMLPDAARERSPTRSPARIS